MPATGVIFLKAAIAFFICLALGDVVGVVACTIFDIAPIRGNSAALPCAIWFVLGIFVGLFAMAGAATWISGKEDFSRESAAAAARATRIFLCGLVVAVAMAVSFWWIYWSQGVAGDYYVPDSAPHTIVYLFSALAGMWLGRLVSQPQPKA